MTHIFQLGSECAGLPLHGIAYSEYCLLRDWECESVDALTIRNLRNSLAIKNNKLAVSKANVDLRESISSESLD